VPQFLGRLDFVSALERLCDDVGADFIEVALLSSPQDTVDRFARRSAASQTAEHRNAQALSNAVAASTPCVACTTGCSRSWRTDHTHAPS